MLLVLLTAGTGCAGAIQGQVLDAQTGQPIVQAVVLGVWTKIAGIPGLQHHELVNVKETETDAEGRFSLERPESLAALAENEAVTIYKFGYVAWSNLYTFPTSPLNDDTRVPPSIALKRFPPGQSHQRHMDFISEARWSVMYGLDRIPKFWGALQQERLLP
jgi:hypothetical protein